MEGQHCIEVNNAPHRCGVFSRQDRFGSGDHHVGKACAEKARREHEFWREKILNDAAMKASGAIMWVRCVKGEEAVPVEKANARTVERKTIVGGQ